MNVNSPRIAVVGATGAVGTTLLELIHDRGFEYSRIDAVASERSAGSSVPFAGGELEVQSLNSFDFSQTDIAFFSAGTSVSRKWAREAASAGALVIDNTNAFRMDPDSPLVVPQVNGSLAEVRPTSGIIGNPNCSTIPLVRVLHSLRSWTPRTVIVTTFQAASGQGLRGLDELRNSSRAVIAEDTVDRRESDRFGRMLAFDVLPMIDVPLDSGFSLEEQKMTQESTKILDDPDIAVTATCVRVPVFNCHSESVYIEFEDKVDVSEVVQALSTADEVTVYPNATEFPSPATISDHDRVHVGRIRAVPGNPRALWLWLVADNVRIGAALNAIQIAERVKIGAVA
ncbi:aspartate-semialdehyde dehydrogenase [Rhodococcus sp. IEGM 1330]|uniref:aspartate-semialdehyde dehydrogenase n=1 Tax=Rhodococcus sp. IEGM 1330 TaxID=3082225 RepID=UPI0029535897|nr:aspartate-semialdehyde dehydrogenase [Rhodococcus sp. IEGM 1330]MDV8023952.1 aspartate-semialdehyde dehydrogenase [Rhodococcus sp. IEGM 1330]